MTDDYYRFDDRQMIMIGERTNRQFRIGDEVTVRVANVIIEESSIDFEIVGMVTSYGRTRKAAPTVIHARKITAITKVDAVAEAHAMMRKKADVVAIVEAVVKRMTVELIAHQSKVNDAKVTVIHVDAAKMTQAQVQKRVKQKQKFYEGIAKKAKRKTKRK